MPLEVRPDALLGAVLEGRFKIERLLGEGGMGRVYVADETRLRRRCALKVLLPELAQDKECVERFLREAQAIAQIHHENVVDIYHLGEDAAQGVVFFAMELLSGQDLETRLQERNQRPIEWQQVVAWMSQVAGAMAAVHAAGMIHRDLKPSNIFITRRRDGRDQIKLLDFGIAKIASHAALTNTGAAIGTPFYMSPEQILAESLDHRTDIYSLGVLFYEALAGRMPFVGEPIQVAMQHCNVNPHPLSALVPERGVPPDLDELILRMLAKNRDDRPQTMEEIEAFLADLVPSTAVHGSGMHRPITGPIAHGTASGDVAVPARDPAAASLAAAPTIAASEARTQPFTPARGTPQAGDLPPASPPARGPKAGRAPGPASRRLPLIIASSVLLAGLATVVVLLASDRDRDRGRDRDPPVTAPLAPQPPPLRPPPETKVDPKVETKTDPKTDPDPPPTEPDPPPEDPKGGKKNPKTGDPKTGDPKPKDPLARVRKTAAGCRKDQKATAGPKIVVTYSISASGSILTATTKESGPLADCLKAAVKAAVFPPDPDNKTRLGQTIEL